ncbi:DUF3135 domain-containing protein [Ferribacterium limneticum]|uniref:DUF3135 domain-containing protein n=1 Tax=Ferribacterium limneticum TaxID=76259 RepID=UPI001CF85372|nr:DUF3135 domain-containing protein [Ferribacterium limneticum]UCV23671.1 DUF3135 domain-containing protein [Ferribacterium limneticum]
MTIVYAVLHEIEAQLKEFNFDQLSDLARRDPQSFIEARSNAINSAILAVGRTAPELELLQDQIDVIRAIASDPQESLVAITALLEQRIDALVKVIGLVKTPLGPVAIDPKSRNN